MTSESELFKKISDYLKSASPRIYEDYKNEKDIAIRSYNNDSFWNDKRQCYDKGSMIRALRKDVVDDRRLLKICGYSEAYKFDEFVSVFGNNEENKKLIAECISYMEELKFAIVFKCIDAWRVGIDSHVKVYEKASSATCILSETKDCYVYKVFVCPMPHID